MSAWNARNAGDSGGEMKAERLRPWTASHADHVAPGASTRLDRLALTRIQRTVQSAPVRFMLWDGFEVPSMTAPVGTILFKNRTALLSWAWDASLNFGETYMSGAIEIRGDLLTVLEAIYRGWESSDRRPWWLLEKSNDAHAARENVHHHYDLGNDFYRLWLDREMVYTCAYFPTADATLEAAQIAKMDLVCRKLRLVPGEPNVWMFVGVNGVGKTTTIGKLAAAQAHEGRRVLLARNRAKGEGLADRVEFVEDDYRHVGGTFDVFVSVGMLEHVGAPDYPTLGRAIDRSLSDRGRGLLHFIGRNQPAPINPWIRKRIFPGAYAPTLREVFGQVLEPHTFSVLDVENMRLHYAKTLEHWGQRFNEASGEVATMFDESFVRAWRLYLAGSQASFTTGSLQLFQVVFTRANNNDLPWTRVSG